MVHTLNPNKFFIPISTIKRQKNSKVTMSSSRVLRSRPPVDYKLLHSGDFELEKHSSESVSVLPGIFSIDRIITRKDSPNVSTHAIN